jgi:hypothetical protein
MKMHITIDSSGNGVSCYATTDDTGMTPAEANLHAIGALEIAKASLLANRWGLNIGGLTAEPLVKPEPVKKPKRESA